MKISKLRIIICAVVALFVGGGAVTAGVVIANSNKDNNEPYVYSYANYSKVGQYSEYLGETKRHKPEVSNGGLERYPVYGQSFKKAEGQSDEDFIQLRYDILAENRTLISVNNSDVLEGNCNVYDEMDENGYLYLNGEPVNDENNQPRKLYKHTAAEGMYFGNVADDEPAIIKRITINPRTTADNYITGLYAPAGEVIKIEISAEDLAAIGGAYVYIGQIFYNCKANNIWIDSGVDDNGNTKAMSREYVRMPVIATKFPIKTTTLYVGSYLGGPIYIGKVNKMAEFSVKISGAVRYNHFILGATSPEEFEQNSKSSAPYFDLEVWDDGVRFSGPNSQAKDFSFNDLYKSAVLWDKISRVSNLSNNSGLANLGIAFVYDPFVAAGAAVAFVGANTVNNPVSWMRNVLDYDAFVANGSWGDIHEFNHHYQGYGLPNGGEVTNNALNLVEYMLFTNISAKRTVEDSGIGNDWPRFLDPARALKITLNVPEKKAEAYWLSEYANLQHAFGPDLFMQAIRYNLSLNSQVYTTQVDRWYKAICEVYQQDFAYYVETLCGWEISEQVKAEIEAKQFADYVPIATGFQSGVSFYLNGKKQFSNTVRPFELEPDTPFEFNLQQSLVYPSRFSARIKNVSKPKYGKLQDLGEGQYKYTFDKKFDISGDIIATVELVDTQGNLHTPDVDILIQFKKKTTAPATVTTYTFDDTSGFNTIDEAINSISSAKNVETSNFSSTQYASKSNTLNVLEGKFKISQGGRYTFAVGARYFAKAELSFDGKKYVEIAKFENVDISTYVLALEGGYFKDFDIKHNQWVYYRLTVLHKQTGVKAPYIALGYGFAENGASGILQANNRAATYSIDSIFEPFEIEYFYNRSYSLENLSQEKIAPKILDTNFSPDGSGYFNLENIFDGSGREMHSSNFISEDNPFEMTIDLGTKITANKVVIVGRHDGQEARNHTPVDFKIYVGNSKDDLHLLKECKDWPIVNTDAIVEFNETSFRYYKLFVTKTTTGRYICLRGVNFQLDFTGGKQLSPDSKMFKYTGDWKVNYSGATFGHTYSTKSGKLQFEFEGSQFALLLKGSAAEFTIKIDNQKSQKISIKNSQDLKYLTHISKKLSSGKHKVIVEAKNLNFDSLVIR